jgi:hypothetical protein
VGKIGCSFDGYGRRDCHSRAAERINRHESDFMPVKSVEPSSRSRSPSKKSDWSELDGQTLASLLGGRERTPRFFKRLIASPRPATELRGGHGFRIVKLQVYKADGRSKYKGIAGRACLADAHAEAVKGWRAKPHRSLWHSAETISTVTFDFELR